MHLEAEQLGHVLIYRLYGAEFGEDREKEMRKHSPEKGSIYIRHLLFGRVDVLAARAKDLGGEAFTFTREVRRS